MKLSQAILRFFGRKTEEQRQAFRMLLSCAMANAEDLNKTACHVVERINTRQDIRQKRQR